MAEKRAEIARTVGKMATLVVLIVLLLGLLSVLLKPADDTNTRGVQYSYIYEFEKLPPNTLDVYFLGDSNLQTDVDTPRLQAQYGISSYVSGSPMQNMLQCQELLTKVFQTQNPKVVVLDTDPLFIGGAGKKDLLTGAAEQVFPVFRYHDNWKMLLGGPSFESDNPGVETLGYYAHDAVQPYTDADHVQASADETEVVFWSSVFLDNINQLCKEHGATLVLISVPCPAYWDQAFHDSAQACADERGLAYYDLNYMPELGLDWSTDTFDKGTHLNVNGAAKVTTWMAQMLQNYL